MIRSRQRSACRRLQFKALSWPLWEAAPHDLVPVLLQPTAVRSLPHGCSAAPEAVRGLALDHRSLVNYGERP